MSRKDELAENISLTGRWRRRPKRSISIRVLITLVVVLVFVASAAVMAGFVAWRSTESRISEAYLRARGAAAELAQLYADAIQQRGHHSLSGVDTVLENWFSETYTYRDLAWAYVRGENGQVVIGKLRAHLVNHPAELKTDAEIRDWFFAHADSIEGDFFKPVAPLERAVGDKRVRFAEVKLGYSLARIRGGLWSQILNWQLAVPIVIGATLLIVLLLFFFRWIILNPLKALASAMDDVRRGWYDTQVKPARHDEIGTLAEIFNYMVRGLEERERLEDAFKRYVSPQVLDKIQSSGTTIHFRGETRRVAVLFSDIRGFTTMSEKLLPEQVVAQLTEYFTDMVDVVMRHDGYINKFVGDAIMAVWGAPLDQDQLEMRAVRAGVEMIESLSALNNRRAARREPPIDIGIGISTGFAVAGNIGHTDRLEYTVIGDAVNIAKRIEAETKQLHRMLLISESTYQPIAGSVVADELPTILVKGKEEPLKLYAVHGFTGDEHTARQPFAPEPSPLAAPALRTGPEELSPPGQNPLPRAEPERGLPEVTAPMPTLAPELTPIGLAPDAPTAPDLEAAPATAASQTGAPLQPGAPFAPPPPTVPAYRPVENGSIPLVRGTPETTGQFVPQPITGVMNKPAAVPQPTAPPAAAKPAAVPASGSKAEQAKQQGIDVPVDTTGELDFWTKPPTKSGPDGD
ncbi:MAG: HAMP domain-containing protein [Deltaproteobacteria bacterium]|nr:HAMP domain-containing protein [Deltaproteobacteria bacterium]